MSDGQPSTPEHQTEWPVIHAYTRAEALADGVLVDVTTTAREAGFQVPTGRSRPPSSTSASNGPSLTRSRAAPTRTSRAVSGTWCTSPRSRRGRSPSAACARIRSSSSSTSRRGPGAPIPAAGPSSSSSAPATTTSPVATIMLPNERLNPAGNRTIGCPPQRKNVKGDRAEPLRDRHPPPARRPLEPAPLDGAGPKRERRARPRKRPSPTNRNPMTQNQPMLTRIELLRRGRERIPPRMDPTRAGKDRQGNDVRRERPPPPSPGAPPAPRGMPTTASPTACTTPATRCTSKP